MLTRTGIDICDKFCTKCGLCIKHPCMHKYQARAVEYVAAMMASDVVRQWFTPPCRKEEACQECAQCETCLMNYTTNCELLAEQARSLESA